MFKENSSNETPQLNEVLRIWKRLKNFAETLKKKRKHLNELEFQIYVTPQKRKHPQLNRVFKNTETP